MERSKQCAGMAARSSLMEKAGACSGGIMTVPCTRPEWLGSVDVSAAVAAAPMSLRAGKGDDSTWPLSACDDNDDDDDPLPGCPRSLSSAAQCAGIDAAMLANGHRCCVVVVVAVLCAMVEVLLLRCCEALVPVRGLVCGNRFMDEWVRREGALLKGRGLGSTKRSADNERPAGVRTGRTQQGHQRKLQVHVRTFTQVLEVYRSI